MPHHVRRDDDDTLARTKPTVAARAPVPNKRVIGGQVAYGHGHGGRASTHDAEPLSPYGAKFAIPLHVPCVANVAAQRAGVAVDQRDIPLVGAAVGTRRVGVHGWLE